MMPVALALPVSIVALDQIHKSASLRMQRYPGPSRRPSINRQAFVCRLSPRLASACLAALVACTACIAVTFESATGRPALVALGLYCILAGSTSNLCDRLHRGSVVDSLLLRGKLAFNLADTAAVCGTAVVLGSLFVPRAALL